jgi:hypothetical protein
MHWPVGWAQLTNEERVSLRKFVEGLRLVVHDDVARRADEVVAGELLQVRRDRLPFAIVDSERFDDAEVPPLVAKDGIALTYAAGRFCGSVAKLGSGASAGEPAACLVSDLDTRAIETLTKQLQEPVIDGVLGAPQAGRLVDQGLTDAAQVLKDFFRGRDPRRTSVRSQAAILFECCCAVFAIELEHRPGRVRLLLHGVESGAAFRAVEEIFAR